MFLTPPDTQHRRAVSYPLRPGVNSTAPGRDITCCSVLRALYVNQRRLFQLRSDQPLTRLAAQSLGVAELLPTLLAHEDGLTLLWAAEPAILSLSYGLMIGARSATAYTASFPCHSLKRDICFPCLVGDGPQDH